MSHLNQALPRQLAILGVLASRRLCYDCHFGVVRSLDFSNVVGTGDWSADILVRLCVMVNPQAHRRTRMSALQNNMSCARKSASGQFSIAPGSLWSTLPSNIYEDHPALSLCYRSDYF